MNKTHTKSHNQSCGFTLIELMVVIVIIGILASLVIVGYGNWRQTTIKTQMKLDLNSAAMAMENSKASNGKYPATIPSTFTPGENMALSGGGNYDGETYCIEATSTQDTSVEYHIISGSSVAESGACPPPVTFIMGWGGTLEDNGSSIIQTSDGGYAVTGYTMSYAAGAQDMFLAKYTSDGTLSWSKTWGGTGSDYGNFIVQTSDDGFIVAGDTFSYTAGGYDMFLAKYTSDGTLSWSKTWGGANYDMIDSFVQTSDGGYAATGLTGNNTAGNFDMHLAKYTSDGTLSWYKTWGGVNRDQGNSLIQTSDDGYAVAGQTASFTAGSDDMFLAKYTSDGTLSWSKTWGGVNYDKANSVVQTSDGGYAVTGYTSSYTAGGNDMFLAKYTSDGTLSWSKTWGGTGSDYGRSLIQTNDDSIVVIGETSSYTAGGTDMFLAKYTSDGTLSWSKTWGGTSSDAGNSLIQTNDGGYAAVGYTLSYTTGNLDMFLAKYASDWTITNCLPTMCQDRSATSVDRSVTGVDRSVTGVNQTLTGVDRSVTGVDRSVTTKVIVAP